MSLKPIELQVALPRATEAGQTQQQLNQKPLIDQQQLAADRMKEQESQRKKSAKVDESASKQVRGDAEGQSGQGRSFSKREDPRKPGKEEHAGEHPYKGKHIDLSL